MKVSFRASTAVSADILEERDLDYDVQACAHLEQSYEVGQAKARVCAMAVVTRFQPATGQVVDRRG